MAETLLMKNVKYLVTCDDNDRFMTDINMLVTDGVITYIGTEEKTADKIYRQSHEEGLHQLQQGRGGRPENSGGFVRAVRRTYQADDG